MYYYSRVLRLRMWQFKPIKVLLNATFAVFGLCLLIWLLYLGNYSFFCSWHFEDSEARFLVLGDPQMEGDSRIARQGYYGQIDIMYNDAYFKHIVSNIMKYLSPTHVFVLGDLFSSQYVSDEEFNVRVTRYADIFESVIGKVPLYNITGNHDLGYAGEATLHQVQRFEGAFGPVNDELVVAGHLIGIVNSINVDTSLDEHLRQQTWDHMDELSQKSQENGMPLVIMTHIPLHKESYEEANFRNTFSSNGGKVELCTDRSYTIHTGDGYIDVQNMLLPESTHKILSTMQPKFVFNGHDHDGCIYRHNEQTVEYTIRSMMGAYGGYAGLFEIRRNNAVTDTPYAYHYTPCPFVRTITTTVTLIVTAVYLLLVVIVNIFFVLFTALQRSQRVEEAKVEDDECIEELGYAKAKSA